MAGFFQNGVAGGYGNQQTFTPQGTGSVAATPATAPTADTQQALSGGGGTSYAQRDPSRQAAQPGSADSGGSGTAIAGGTLSASPSTAYSNPALGSPLPNNRRVAAI